jgi:hypothetical protein
LKTIFKGAANAAILYGRDDPLYHHYQRLLDGGTKPTLARLTLARQLASIILSMWRSGEVYNPGKLKQHT